MHASKPFFSAQFHPEACGGPTDTNHLFDKFIAHCRDRKLPMAFESLKPPGERPTVRKVLILGRYALLLCVYTCAP